VDAKITCIATSLRDRMRFYKLDVAKDATANAIAFNSTVKPELIPEENDPYRIQWVTTPPSGECVVGERVSSGEGVCLR
jgi:actin-related protein 8